MLVNLEINKENLRKNLEKIRSINKNLICVVKDNAYGLGIENILPILFENNCNYFAVAYIEEAAKIRKILENFEKEKKLGFLENKNGEVSLKNDSSSSGKKVNKKISFTQENNKINTDIETLPIVPLDVKKKIKKKNMTIVKNNSEYLNTLKEIEMSI